MNHLDRKFLHLHGTCKVHIEYSVFILRISIFIGPIQKRYLVDIERAQNENILANDGKSRNICDCEGPETVGFLCVNQLSWMSLCFHCYPKKTRPKIVEGADNKRVKIILHLNEW